MKSFFASFFGALVALVVFVFGGIFLTIVFFAMVAASAEAPQKPGITPGSYLVLDLSRNLTDAPSPFEEKGKLGKILGTDRNQLQLRDVLVALDEASRDSRIAGVFITGGWMPEGYGTGFAALREVRGALESFKESRKPVIAYAENLDTRDYYVKSAATELILHPFGLVWMPGLAAEGTFFAGTLEKLGVGVQPTRAGKYKSAIETFTRKSFSPENREATQKLIDDVWTDLREQVAASRKLAPAEFQALIEKPEPQLGETAKTHGLVDRVAYWDEVLAELKRRTGADEDDRTFRQVSVQTYAAEVKSLRNIHGDRVAVVYAEGEIVGGDGEYDQVGGERFARELRRIRNDPSIKAVVLRVNSPGGSADASEVIAREVRLLKAEKPVVVSMGTVAASGGYWIATHADHIFAQPTTITGSIGVFGLMMNIEELSKKIGVSYDVVKTGRFADSQTISRPKTEEEMQGVQAVIDWIYDGFLARVAEGRKLDRAAVEQIAQGRVWSGVDAKRVGLVDDFGGLQDAIAFAAKKAGLDDDYRVLEYPRRREFAEVFRELFEDTDETFTRIRLANSPRLVREFEMQLRAFESFNDPRGAYVRLPVDLHLR